MSYVVKARYYANRDQFGESFVLTSDNSEIDMKIEVGRRVLITPLCKCGRMATIDNLYCEECGEETHS